MDIETGRHEGGDKEPLKASCEHGWIDIGGTGEVCEREAERIIRINARACVVFQEGTLWQVGRGNVGKGTCKRLFVLDLRFSGGSPGGRSRLGSREGGRNDALLHLYGGIDDPHANIRGS